jgi:hypothetical protein
MTRTRVALEKKIERLENEIERLESDVCQPNTITAFMDFKGWESLQDWGEIDYLLEELLSELLDNGTPIEFGGTVRVRVTLTYMEE